MHAALACYLARVELDAIAEGLSGFRMSFESTPGRLNVFDELPFRVIMDYAHNVDGFIRLCSFVDQQKVSGKKILMFGFSGDRQDKDIMEAAGQLAGHFDNYVCRNFRFTRGREPGEVPGLLKAGLQAAGVREQAISLVTDHQEALERTLNQAQPGDLVVLLVGATEFISVWDMLHSEAGLQTRPE